MICNIVINRDKKIRNSNERLNTSPVRLNLVAPFANVHVHICLADTLVKAHALVLTCKYIFFCLLLHPASATKITHPFVNVRVYISLSPLAHIYLPAS